MDVLKEFIISTRGEGTIATAGNGISYIFTSFIQNGFFFKQTQVNHGNKPNQINLKLIKQSQ